MWAAVTHVSTASAPNETMTNRFWTRQRKEHLCLCFSQINKLGLTVMRWIQVIGHQCSCAVLAVWLRPNNPLFVPWKWSRTSVHELKEICREIFFPFQEKILPHFFSGDSRKMFFYSDMFWFISFWLVTKIFKANPPLAPVGCLYCSSSYLIAKGCTLKLVIIHSELFL